MSEATLETHSFQAEIKQLLDLVVHSLYTDREIFLRELISNASDSMEKLRHLQGTEKDIHDAALPLEIHITTDAEAKTLTIADRGIGMTRGELVENLGTIAHSGTKAFLQAMKESGNTPANMIGQFGVGFYSAFMVAGEVQVHTRSWRENGESLVWTSDGASGYSIEESAAEERGVKLVLKLKEEHAEFADAARVKRLIEQYSKMEPAVALYCKKVLIDPAPKGLLPEWMRFLKGVIDSADLPLNISRETMQDSALVRKLGSVIGKRVLKMFEKEAESDPEKYQGFYRKFERFFMEGVATDYAHREGLAKLLRFESSMTEEGKLASFADYLTRAKDGQDKIYYLVGPGRAQLESSPYVEAFKARGLEVIYFTDPVDEYVVESLGEYEGKKLVSISHSGVELEDTAAEGEALGAEETEKLCSFLKEELGEKVTAVSAGKRLVDSPVIALVPQDGMTAQMRRMMKAMDENFKDEVKVELEINPRHPLVKKLAETREKNPELAKMVASQMLDNALIAAGLLDDARDLVKRMNALMEKAMA